MITNCFVGLFFILIFKFTSNKEIMKEYKRNECINVELSYF